MTAYSDALQSGTTTLCRCFLLTRADGEVLGFTDHDSDVSWDGVTFVASAALTASEAAATLGLAPDNMDAQGALSDDAITEADLVAGVYDGASVEVWDVDWRAPDTRAILGRYTIGEVERGPLGFRAELRSLSASLDSAQGRVHTSLCDVRRLGNARCGVDLTDWQEVATVSAVDGLLVTLSGITAEDVSRYARGIITWTSGDNAGAEVDIRAVQTSGTDVVLSLWRLPARAIALGDAVQVTAGCDRTAAMCSARFGNLTNFRGFPHMPGSAFLTEAARSGDANQDGGSRFA